MTAIERAIRYIAKLPPAVSGSGGHAATYRTASRLREFGLSWSEALTVLTEWNGTHCQPKWTKGELEHKLADAFRNVAPQSAFVQRNGAKATRPPRRQLPPQRTPQAGGTNAPRALPRIPEHHRGTGSEIAALARLRGLSVAGLRLASERGLLRFGEFMERAAWFILDKSGRMAQARPMSGLPWFTGVKAWTLKRSQAQWPVGIEEAQAYPIIALTEGGGDLLALCHLIAAARRRDIAPVAVLGAAMNLHSAALPHFKGKRVCVFAQNDDAGRKAEERWVARLRPVAASIESINVADLCFDAEPPPTDWNELVSLVEPPSSIFDDLFFQHEDTEEKNTG